MVLQLVRPLVLPPAVGVASFRFMLIVFVVLVSISIVIAEVRDEVFDCCQEELYFWGDFCNLVHFIHDA